MANQETALVRVEPSRGIELYDRIANPLEGIERMGTWIAKSGMFGCDKVEQGMVLAMECMTTRKAPSVIARTYHIMDGKLSKKALGALAEFNDMGGEHEWLRTGDEPVTKEDDRAAELKLTLKGKTVTVRFSIADAKRMGASFKAGSGWVKSPANMLRARCASNGVAMLAPGIFAGDVEDEPTERAALPLLMQQPAAQVVPPKGEAVKTEAATTAPTPQPVIEAQVVDDQIPGAEVVTYPVEEKPEPFKAKSIDGLLTVETMGAINAALGPENIDTAAKWLVAKGKIKEATPQGFRALSELMAQNILDRTAEFIKAIGGK